MAAQNLDNELTRLRIDKSRKRPRGRGLRWFTILLLLALSGGGYFYYQKANAALPVKMARPVISSGPEAGAPVLTAGGYVIPRNQIEVSPQIVGRIQDIYVDRGSKVKQGDVLLKIEDSEYQARVSQAEAALASSKARLAELLAGSRREEIQAAQAAVNSAEATLKNAEADFKRIESLSADEVISRQALDRAKTEFNVADANLDSARKNFELVRKGPRKEVIDAARAQAHEAEANLEYARTQLNYTVIRAPISGTVIEKLAKKGELVSFQSFGGTRGAKTSVLTMADLQDLQVEIDLNENDLAKVHMGQPGEIRLDSLPDQVFKGMVDEIAPAADRQKATVQIKVAIKNPTSEVRPEVNARVTFLDSGEPKKAAGRQESKIYIPRAALAPAPQGSPEGSIVYLVSGGVAVARPVKLGDEGPKGVQVVEGLKGDEQIIVDPPPLLKAGMKVAAAT